MSRVLTTRYVRRRPDRLVAGVCTGLARAWRLDTSVVRLGVLVLCLAGGIGVVFYGGAWLVMPETEDASPAPTTSRVDNAAALVALAGGLLVLRSVGVWTSDSVALVGGLAIVGVILVWGRSVDGGLRSAGGAVAARIAVGVALVGVGLVALSAITGDLGSLGRSLLGAAVAVVGIALLAGPRLSRLAGEVAAERRARIRSEEKAEIAAHLHDGVLQTLALVQRRAGDNREVAALARRQERELRAWLYGGPPVDGETLAGTLARELATVEDDHDVRIELVCVGDAPLDDGVNALVAAAREAATNAARHAEVERLDVYVEVEPSEITAFVRDRGRGFDPTAVPEDRRGLAESVTGRMRRAGGSADVRSTLGAGTEVMLSVPRRHP